MSWTLVSATCKLKRFIQKEVAEMRPMVPPREGAEESSDGARPTSSCYISGICSQSVRLIIFKLFSVLIHLWQSNFVWLVSSEGLGAQAAEGLQSVTERGRVRRLCKGSRDDSSVALQPCHLPFLSSKLPSIMTMRALSPLLRVWQQKQDSYPLLNAVWVKAN